MDERNTLKTEKTTFRRPGRLTLWKPPAKLGRTPMGHVIKQHRIKINVLLLHVEKCIEKPVEGIAEMSVDKHVEKV